MTFSDRSASLNQTQTDSLARSVLGRGVFMSFQGLSPHHILVVDDDPEVTDSYARMLKLEGYDVETAANGAEGLTCAERCAPDAIILDLRMPLVDGQQFLERLRAVKRGVAAPVAIVTGNYLIDAEVVARLRDLGAQVYFKPIWLEDLVDITKQLLEQPASVHGPQASTLQS